jgi:transposase-like protein
MKPIPPERREAIPARLGGPAREPVARVAAQEGISPATLYLWRRKARQSGALLPDHDDAPEGWSAREAGLQRLQRGDRDRIRHLESELRRREKALAEAAALLVLQKKARAVWGEEDA